jgi:hypothetical protein
MVRYAVIEEDLPTPGEDNIYLVIEQRGVVSEHTTRSEAEAARDRLQREEQSRGSRSGGGRFDVAVQEPEIFF